MNGEETDNKVRGSQPVLFERLKMDRCCRCPVSLKKIMIEDANSTKEEISEGRNEVKDRAKGNEVKSVIGSKQRLKVVFKVSLP